MQERGNKTIMCSVLFLDIVEYSKKSVAGQISLKDRFNSYLSTAIQDVPVADRIILDTGDGAAINFLGDVEDALKAALSLRESLLGEDPAIEPPLLVRMGINLGPVRLVRDINGQPNIVGDGINVAQRVMGFADASQILVSRSYFDAVSRLSPTYAGMFHYQGSRTDKHVREHEIYAIGYPGDQTAKHAEGGGVAEFAASRYAGLAERARQAWESAVTRVETLAASLFERYRQANPKQRAIYAASLAVPVLLIGGALMFAGHDETSMPIDDQILDSNVSQAISAVAPLSANAGGKAVVAKADAPAATAKPEVKKATEGKAEVRKTNGQTKPSHEQPKARASEPSKPWYERSTSPGADAYVVVSCKEGTQVFVDGSQKGKVGSSALTVPVVPAVKHTVIVSHPSGGIYTQNIELAAGKTLRIRPGFCD